MKEPSRIINGHFRPSASVVIAACPENLLPRLRRHFVNTDMYSAPAWKLRCHLVSASGHEVSGDADGRGCVPASVPKDTKCMSAFGDLHNRLTVPRITCPTYFFPVKVHNDQVRVDIKGAEFFRRRGGVVLYSCRASPKQQDATKGKKKRAWIDSTAVLFHGYPSFLIYSVDCARRNPTRMILPLASGTPEPLLSDRQPSAGMAHPPPRITRWEPDEGPSGSIAGLAE